MLMLRQGAVWICEFAALVKLVDAATPGLYGKNGPVLPPPFVLRPKFTRRRAP